MTWLIDNAGALSVLLGIIAAGLIAFWWSNRQTKYLTSGIAVIGLLVLLRLVILFVPSDRRQMEDNVRAMAVAVEKGNVDELFKHISKDFRFQSLTRDKMKEATEATLQFVKIREVSVRKFEMLEHAQKSAKMSFHATAWVAGDEHPRPVRIEATFALEGNRWLLTGLDLYFPPNSTEKFNPFVH